MLFTQQNSNVHTAYNSKRGGEGISSECNILSWLRQQKKRISIDAMDSLWHISDTKKECFLIRECILSFSISEYAQNEQWCSTIGECLCYKQLSQSIIRISITTIFMYRKVG